MSDELPIGSGDDELERRIAALESDEWLVALKGLKPIQGVDLYAIGFEAGKQSNSDSAKSVRSANTSGLHARTALISSMASVAATLLMVFALQERASRQEIGPGKNEVVQQIDQSMGEVELAPQLAAESVSQSSSIQSSDASFNDVLAGVPSIWRDRLQDAELKVPNSDNSNRVVDVEPRRLRYAFQRRQLIENLGETIQ